MKTSSGICTIHEVVDRQKNGVIFEEAMKKARE